MPLSAGSGAQRQQCTLQAMACTAAVWGTKVRLPDNTVYHCTGHSKVYPFSTKREFVRAFMASDLGEPYRSLSEDTYVCW